jgi:hypothetical protein
MDASRTCANARHFDAEQRAFLEVDLRLRRAQQIRGERTEEGLVPGEQK